MPTSLHSRRDFFRASKGAPSAGFTLIELLVVIAIIAILAVMIFANYRQYDSEVILQNKAYEVALAIRNAQLRSISIGGADFTSSTGIRFDRQEGANAAYRLCLYAGDGAASGGDCGDAVELTDRIFVSDVRTKDVESETYSQRNFADIKFVRPHLTGLIAANGGTFNPNIEEVAITLSNPAGSSRTIFASQTGMVSVRASETSSDPGSAAPPPSPQDPACSFSATPSSIITGQPTTLQWTTANVTSVSINQGIGSVGTNGSHQVSPTQPTTYTLTASGQGGSTNCQTTVTVSAAPVCAASPASVYVGETVTWSVSNPPSGASFTWSGDVTGTGNPKAVSYATAGTKNASVAISGYGTIPCSSVTVTAVAPGSQTFTSSGTWTRPAGVTSVRVELIGGGGGGSGSDAGGNGGKGGGGGGCTIATVAVSSNISVTIGAGGNGGTGGSGGTAGNGGNTTFGALALANGGKAGSGHDGGGAGGAAGAGCFKGGNGGNGSGSGNKNGGGGGGGAGLSGAGSNGTAGTTSAVGVGGNGGSGNPGTGKGGNGGEWDNSPAPQTGTTYGAGGGGGGYPGGGNHYNGAAGASGWLRVSWPAP